MQKILSTLSTTYGFGHGHTIKDSKLSTASYKSFLFIESPTRSGEILDNINNAYKKIR